MILAGTWGGGIWKRPISEMSGVSREKSSGKSLCKAHSGTNATIRTGSLISVDLTLSHSDFVSIVLYDLAGKKIQTILTCRLSTGSYSYPLEIQGLSKGIYVLRLLTGTDKSEKIIQIAQ